MAATVELVRFTFENGVSFKMDWKQDDGSYVTIIEMEENGHIETLWNNAAEICKTFLAERIKNAGAVMKG